MNVRAFRTLVIRPLAAVAASVLFAVPAALAVPVELSLTGLRAIQQVSDTDKVDDHAYAVITGSAQGKALEMAKLPKDGTWSVSRRKVGITPDAPVSVWKGDLGDGEFAAVTITVFQGEGTDAAKLKDYTGKLADAAKAVPALSAAKVASADDLKKLSLDLLKAHRTVVVDERKWFGKENKADHFGGQFTVVAWNNAGKVLTRLDPVGLTFGEHFGDGPKVYTKLKLTRQNVLVKDDTGDWGSQQLAPLNDEETDVRVKMLEAVALGKDAKGDDKKKVVDYLTEIRVTADGKPIIWTLGGDVDGPKQMDIQKYWEFAETKPEKKKKK